MASVVRSIVDGFRSSSGRPETELAKIEEWRESAQRSEPAEAIGQ